MALFAEQIENLTRRLEALYVRANKATGGVPDMIRHVIEGIDETRTSQAAAGITYYALFSLFPTVLFLIVVVSYFVEEQTAQELVLAAVAQVVPNSKGVLNLIDDTVNAVFNLRGEIGIISLIGLLWSASAAFTTLAYNVDVAWVRVPKRARPPLLQRLVGIAMILVVGGTLVLILVLSAAARMLIAIDSPLLDQLGLDGELLSWLGSSVLTLLLPYLVFVAIYRWVPSVKVPWSAAAIAGLIASVAWQIANAGFSWYLGSGLVRYELIYGSLTTVIVLMLWLYLSFLILLVGAHLSAAIAQRLQKDAPLQSPSLPQSDPEASRKSPPQSP